MVDDIQVIYGYVGFAWWNHPFFDERYKGAFVGIGADSYINFPTEDDKIMFMLKFGAK
jgi:hypothetical protein